MVLLLLPPTCLGLATGVAPMLPHPLPLVHVHENYRQRHSCVQSKFSPAYDTTIRYQASDWAKNMRSLPQSLILKRIGSPLLFNMLLTLSMCALHAWWKPLPQMIPVPHTLLGSALGLLLVFRTNAAYDRFWEARKTWSIVTAECRQLASLACTFMTADQALPMLSLTAAFPVVLKNYLRGGNAAAQDRDSRRLKALLAREEFQALTSVINQPQFVLTRLRQLSQASSVAGVTEKEREILIKSAGNLGECVSTCERIYNSPIPLAYSRHTSRFLVLCTPPSPHTRLHDIGRSPHYHPLAPLALHY